MLFVSMFDKRMIEAVDPELAAYLREYLSALCRDSVHPGCTTEAVLVSIGKWVVSRLNYPTEVAIETPPRKPKPNRTKRDYREIVFKRDDWKCAMCAASNDLTVDHITPISKGGTTTIENLQTLCRKCNSRKGTKT